MSVSAALLAGRRAAERLMTSKVRVVNPVWVRAADGTESFEDTPVFEGPCKVQTYEPQETNRDAAGAPVVIQRYMLHLPVRAVGKVQVGHIAHIEGRDRPLRIASLLDKTHQTAMRCGVEELSSDPVD